MGTIFFLSKHDKVYIDVPEIKDALGVKIFNDWESELWRLDHILKIINSKDLGVKALGGIFGLSPDKENFIPLEKLENCDPSLKGIVFEINVKRFLSKVDRSDSENKETQRPYCTIEFALVKCPGGHCFYEAELINGKGVKNPEKHIKEVLKSLNLKAWSEKEVYEFMMYCKKNIDEHFEYKKY